MNPACVPGADETVRELLDILDLRPTEPDRFTVQPRAFGRSRVYGGQVFAQALAAGNLTTGDRLPHSAHACFLLPGLPTEPMTFDVERTRDGGAFSCRRVQVEQAGRVILTMILSCHRSEDGFDHQSPMPDVPAPDALASTVELLAQWEQHTGKPAHPMLESSMSGRMGLDVRPVDPDSVFLQFQGPARYAHWVRTRRPVGDDPRLHRWLLGFASDLAFIGTALRPHGQPWYEDGHQPSTIEHSMWFHRPFRADQWLLYTMDSPSAYGGRGLVRGSFYDESGKLVASSAQEGLMRPKPSAAPA